LVSRYQRGRGISVRFPGNSHGLSTICSWLPFFSSPHWYPFLVDFPWTLFGWEIRFYSLNYGL
jgi:hypothetical protein